MSYLYIPNRSKGRGDEGFNTREGRDTPGAMTLMLKLISGVHMDTKTARKGELESSLWLFSYYS